MQCPFFIF